MKVPAIGMGGWHIGMNLVDEQLDSIESIRNPLISTRFHKYLNLFPDQEAGGSNPLAPTYIYGISVGRKGLPDSA